MGTGAQAKSGVVVPVGGDQAITIRPELQAAVDLMMDGIPEAGGDAFESIIGALLTVTDARDLDAPWRSAGLGELANTRIVVRGIRKSPSDFPGGLPFFLLVDGAIADTGEVFTVTTGAASVVVQLAKAHQLGALPLTCIPRIADRPSRNGYYPMHLEMVG
jgi:hypothetical protein